MLDSARHPDIDETIIWHTWGQVLEAHPEMLGGILSMLPEAETVAEGNRRILALYTWLMLADHRNVVVARAPRAPDDQPNHSGAEMEDPSDLHRLENHATAGNASPHIPDIQEQALAATDPRPLALRVVGQNRHIDPPSHLSLPASWQVVATPNLSHREAYDWPHLPADEVAGLIDLPELAGWLDAIHHCEIQWIKNHPETVVARLTAIGDLTEDELGNLSLPSATWEGMKHVIHLPLEHRAGYAGSVEWIRRLVPQSGPDEEASRLREALAPPQLLRDQRFARAAIQISYHPPSEGKLASIAGDRLASHTGRASGRGGRGRL